MSLMSLTVVGPVAARADRAAAGGTARYGVGAAAGDRDFHGVALEHGAEAVELARVHVLVILHALDDVASGLHEVNEMGHAVELGQEEPGHHDHHDDDADAAANEAGKGLRRAERGQDLLARECHDDRSEELNDDDHDNEEHAQGLHTTSTPLLTSSSPPVARCHFLTHGL